MYVPSGLIAVWADEVASIPSNWYLCNGLNSTPDLSDRFVRGAATSEDPGDTGGSDSHEHGMTSAGSHIHVLGSPGPHSHSQGSAGLHQHGSTSSIDAYGSETVFKVSKGAHTHTLFSAGDHEHTLADPGTHAHENTKEVLPPYYNVVYIQAAAEAEVTSGIIIAWTGNLDTIPSGWGLCDGNDDRPDYRSRFLRCVSNDDRSYGGTSTHNHTLQAHTHTHSMNAAGGHSHSLYEIDWEDNHDHNSSIFASGPRPVKYQVDAGFAHEHTATWVGHHTHTIDGVGGSHSHTFPNIGSNVPPYYTVLYIANIGATTIPISGIFVWTNPLESIPLDYDLCNGDDGRPDLSEKFLYGAAAGQNPRNTGGSTSHSHGTTNSTGAHNDHTILDYVHNHGGNSTDAGDHNHNQGTVYVSGLTGGPSFTLGGTAGEHHHSLGYNNHDHTVAYSNPADHDHGDSQAEEHLPPYYDVAFIMANGLPTSSAQNATSVTYNSARLNGRVEQDKGVSCEYRFRYKKQGGSYSYTSWANSKYVNDTFYEDIGSLDSASTYLFNSQVKNIYGEGDWSEEQTFLTCPAAPTNVSATDGDHSNKVVVTWTKSTGATGYRVYGDGELLDTLGDVATYDDEDAPAPTINAGSADASDGTSQQYVTLTLSGHSATQGSSRTYKVVAFNATGDSPDSTTDTGYKGTTTLTYQWQRSATDSDSNYSNLTGATTNPYNDVTAPWDGSGRYYKCVVSMIGADSQISTSDRGYRLPSIGPIIAMWANDLDDIPDNWSLCDGNDTPNLIAKFVYGAISGIDIGNVSGADLHCHSMTSAGEHNHTVGSYSHTHQVNSAGAHAHGLGGRKTGEETVMVTQLGSHYHTTQTGGSHSHTLQSAGAHTHTVNTSDGRPPFYELAFIQAGGGAEVASGIIILWTETIASIPSGWAVCDGDNGPDLRSRFIRGINTAETEPGNIGGSESHNHTLVSASHTHNTDSQGSHTHSFYAYPWTHDHNSAAAAEGTGAFAQTNDTPIGGNHTHSITGGNVGAHTHTVGSKEHNHTVNSASSIPAYYTVAYIINVNATSIPIGGVAIWADTLNDIPGDWRWCSGGDYPDLRGKFVCGTASGYDPGDTGGSNSHNHTEDGTSGNHNDHTISTDGAHQHGATDTIGAHTHNVTDRESYLESASLNDSAGAHSHTFNSGGSHTHTGQSGTGAHNHHPWGTDDGRPAFYEVAFIIFCGKESLFSGTTLRDVVLSSSYKSITRRILAALISYSGRTIRSATKAFEHLGQTLRIKGVATSYVGKTFRNVPSLIGYFGKTRRKLNSTITSFNSTLRNVTKITTYSGQTLRNITRLVGYFGNTYREIKSSADYAGRTVRRLGSTVSYRGKTVRNVVITVVAEYYSSTIRSVSKLTTYRGKTIRDIIVAAIASYYGSTTRNVRDRVTNRLQTLRRTSIATVYFGVTERLLVRLVGSVKTIRVVNSAVTYSSRTARLIGSRITYLGKAVRDVTGPVIEFVITDKNFRRIVDSKIVSSILGKRFTRIMDRNIRKVEDKNIEI